MLFSQRRALGCALRLPDTQNQHIQLQAHTPSADNARRVFELVNSMRHSIPATTWMRWRTLQGERLGPRLERGRATLHGGGLRGGGCAVALLLQQILRVLQLFVIRHPVTGEPSRDPLALSPHRQPHRAMMMISSGITHYPVGLTEPPVHGGEGAVGCGPRIGWRSCAAPGCAPCRDPPPLGSTVPVHGTPARADSRPSPTVR
jgi:hypothetical protein